MISSDSTQRQRRTDHREKTIGRRIRELRTARGISEEALAVECGMRATQMGLLEDGRLRVTIMTLKTIADALNISLGDFFEGVA